MKILSLDTSSDACSCAILKDGELFTDQRVLKQKHANLILSMIEAQCQQAELSLSDLDCIAFAHGPGSFTGIRIAISVSQGLAFANNTPIVALSSLRALAYGSYREHGTKSVIAAIDARMGEIYFSAYHCQANDAIADIEDCLLKPSELPEIKVSDNWIGVGSAWDVFQPAMQGKYPLQERFPSANVQAQDIALLAQQDFQAGKAISVEQVQANYLRNKVAKAKASL